MNRCPLPLKNVTPIRVLVKTILDFLIMRWVFKDARQRQVGKPYFLVFLALQQTYKVHGLRLAQPWGTVKQCELKEMDESPRGEWSMERGRDRTDEFGGDEGFLQSDTLIIRVPPRLIK